MYKVFKAVVEHSWEKGKQCRTWSGSHGFLFLTWSFETCCRKPLKVNGIHSGNCGDWWLLLMLHPPTRSTKTLSRGKGFFLLHLGDELRVQWTLTLGLITLATRDMNNSYALTELACNLLNSHKCLNVFHSKDLSLWDLVKSGNTFSDASVINENCPLTKILQLRLYQWALLSWQIYTPLFH